jgi:hypothetical protein
METWLAYQEAAGELTIPKKDVHRVKLIANKHRLRSAAPRVRIPHTSRYTVLP